jgi:hypothetical protein
VWDSMRPGDAPERKPAPEHSKQYARINSNQKTELSIDLPVLWADKLIVTLFHAFRTLCQKPLLNGSTNPKEINNFF